MNAAWFESLVAPLAAGAIGAILIDDFLVWTGEHMAIAWISELGAAGGTILVCFRVIAFVILFLLAHWILNGR